MIKETTIEKDEIMVSFDVKSLFTSVPTRDATNIIEELIQNDETIEERTGMSPKTFMELAKLCLGTNEFQFQNKYYRLKDGLPMGSPASPVIANIFMIKLEQKALESFEHPPKTWHRFVDDIFTIVKRSQVKNLLHHLNKQHPNISFTVEEEQDNKLPYMDITVHRVGNKLHTDVYRKPTHTGRYLNYNSNHPDEVKRSVVYSLIDRLHYITPQETRTTDTEITKIKEDLHANGYPAAFVQKTIKRRTSKAPKPNDAQQGKSISTTATIPYIRGVSEAIRRILAPHNIRTVMKPVSLKWSLMKGAKDSTPTEETPGVVYAIGCAECPQVYIGETARTTKQRVREHRCHTNTGHTEMSAIAKHALEQGHSIHWKAKVIGREQDSTSRKIKEALMIQKMERRSGKNRIMNQDNGLDLSRVWLDLANTP